MHTPTITREEAIALLKEYNKEPFHIQHGLTVESVMRWYATQLGFEDEIDYWGMTGLFMTWILKCIRNSIVKKPLNCLKLLVLVKT